MITINVIIIGIKNINPNNPESSILIKHVFIGLRPNTLSHTAAPVINNVVTTENHIYFLIFLSGFNIPSIGFKLIFLK